MLINRSALSAFVLMSLFFFSANALADDYEYTIENGWIEMPDGVRLSVTYYLPVPSDPLLSETFPVLLEMLPYRKEDISKAWAHPHYDYFARQGFLMAKVDIRGTGSSEGQTPEREYSNTEIEDAIDVIAALAQLPLSNGKIGMWGISWGGFNSIQVAMRNPPHLYAILAAHSSDDLYTNDVHYTDGIFGIDEYTLSINHMTGFMQSPDYEINDAYFADRFDREPWLFNYMRHSRDGDFWRKGSMGWKYENIQLPIYFIGGLFDGYRDTLPRALENLDTPIRGILGPWTHAWPNGANPGPEWAWREDASKWWKHWLADEVLPNEEYNQHYFQFFLRAGNKPDTSLSEIDGSWFVSDWPLPDVEVQTLKLFPGDNDELTTSSTEKPLSIDSLNIVPSAGSDLGEWWGQLLPDMRATDAYSLTYDSDVLTEALSLVGITNVSLFAAADATNANWIIRLEDVHPDGQVSVITGGAINGSQRMRRLIPTSLTPHEYEELSIPLRFTTWTFKPGHRIRLAISNSAFPMFWPSASVKTSYLTLNTEKTFVSLPIWNGMANHPQLTQTRSQASNVLTPDIIRLGPVTGRPARSEVIINKLDNSVSVLRESGVTYYLGDTVQPEKSRILETQRHTLHNTRNDSTGHTSYKAWAEYRLLPSDTHQDTIRYRTTINLSSDETDFHLNIQRTLTNDNGEIRRKEWSETFPRDHQ